MAQSMNISHLAAADYWSHVDRHVNEFDEVEIMYQTSTLLNMLIYFLRKTMGLPVQSKATAYNMTDNLVIEVAGVLPVVLVTAVLCRRTLSLHVVSKVVFKDTGEGHG